jgi:predicted metal-dependent hydrolase
MIYINNKNKKYSPENYKYVLMHVRSLLKDFSDVLVRDVRISSYFIEMDVSIYNTKEIFVSPKITEKLNSVGSLLLCDDLSEHKFCLTNDCIVDHAIYLFNLERFWKSHEVLEGIWKESKGSEKQILNGIILIDAAFVHYQKNEFDVFISILKRSIEKLRGNLGMFYNLNLNEIKESLNNIIEKKSRHYTFKISVH